ncbi:29193_t:CDS:2, partial [Racocetra persica]
MTYNPNWPEIQLSLLSEQTSQDRPDICACIFRLKLKALFKDIIKNSIFGKTFAYIYVIESQKCGLLYAHILIILSPDCKPHTTKDYDCIISAEIPDSNNLPHEYATVIQCMMHRLCGNYNMHVPCMQDGKYSKGYPKPFQAVISQNEDGYPIYQQCQNSQTVKVKGSHDRATIALNNDNTVDEIHQYIDTCYILAHKSIWCIMHYKMHDEAPNVIRLVVHLPGQHLVTFTDNESLVNVAQLAQNQKSTLKAWFDANCDQNICQIAKSLTYTQFLHNDDILHRILYNPNFQLTQQEIESCALHELEDILMQQGKSLKDFPNMPIPTTVCYFANWLLNEELNYNQAILRNFLDQNLSYVAAQSEFANWLLQVGEGLISEVQPNSSFIRLFSNIIIKSETIQNLIKFVYSNLQANICNPTYFTERGILAPLNDDVDMLNIKILLQFFENKKTYYSADTLDKNSKIYNT